MEKRLEKQLSKSSYLSLEQTRALKGIFAISVLIHHLYQCSGLIHGAIGIPFQYIGYLSVGMFFFFTGYGLIVSNKRNNYINGFTRRKIIPFYAYYTIIILMYSVYRVLIGDKFSTREFVQSFLFGRTLVPLAWYIQVTILIYIVFYIVFKTFVGEKTRIFVMTLAIILYCVICQMTKMSSTWYESIFCVLLGMIWAYKKDIVDKILVKNSFFIAALSFVLFGVSLFLSTKLGVGLKWYQPSFLQFALFLSHTLQLIQRLLIIS